MDNSEALFNRISRVYGWFYGRQKRGFEEAISRASSALDLSRFRSALDVGCGTGALCSVLAGLGLEVTGLDQAEEMLEVARSKPGHQGIHFHRGSALTGLPFEHDRFDVSFASHVAHGMKAVNRARLYAEMSRVTRHAVVIHDYASPGTWITALLEWLEKSDYRHFLSEALEEMIHCRRGPLACFESVRLVPIGKSVAWYICVPSRG